MGFKNGLAVSYSKLGVFYRDYQTDNMTAKHYFEHCYALLQELTEAHPAYAEFSNRFARVKNSLNGL